MYDSLPLTSRMILRRWISEAPEMVTTLETTGQLLSALNQANEQLLETFYQLTVVRKLDYNAALEIALHEWSASPNPTP